MKLTNIQINEIKELIKTTTQLKLAEKFNCCLSTIKYHTNDIEREKTIKRAKDYFNNLSKEKRKELNDKRREYRRNYYKDRYNNDLEFKNKIKEYQKRRKDVKAST